MKMKYIKNIVDRVEAAEKRAAVFYAKTDGLLYKWLKILYVLSLCLSALMGFFYCLSRHFKISELDRLNIKIESFSDIKAVKSSIITVLICSVFWLICASVIKWKQEIVSAVLLISSGSVAVSFLVRASRNTAEFNVGINTAFWWRHFVPLALSLFFIVWMLIIKFRQQHRLKIAYNNMVSRIYETYKREDINEEEWEEFLKNYDPRAEEEKRRREKKNEKENVSILDQKND
jgi:hypothetical protein